MDSGVGKIGNIIQRFESGDSEVQYEYIQSAQDLSVDAMDGDTALSGSAVQGLPVPQCSVEDRLRPLNPFYIEKKVKKKRFVPNIASPAQSQLSNCGAQSKTEAIERKVKADSKKAQRAAEKFSDAISANNNVKIRRSTSQMPVSYNGFIATNLIDHQNYSNSPIELSL